MTRGVATARGNALYVLILGCIARKPMTANEIADEISVGGCSVWPVLRRLRGICVHVTEYRSGVRGKPAVWAFGVGSEPAAPPCAHRVTVPKARSELAAFARVCVLLTEPVSVRQLQAETGITRGTLYLILHGAREQRIAHIAEWDRERRNGCYSPHWAFGVEQKDATKPRRMTRREIDMRNWRGRCAREKQQRMLAALSANAQQFDQRA